MGDYRNLVAWRLAYALCLRVYAASSSFPGNERFGHVSQLRRAAVSVPSNLAEGVGRGSDAELRRFAAIARGSVHELATQLMLSRDLGYLSEEEATQLKNQLGRLGRLLSGLVRRKP